MATTDTGGIVLYKILTTPAEALEVWPKLKLSFFGSEYTSIYSEVSKYYLKYSNLPSFNELELAARNNFIKNNIVTLSLLDIPEDIDLSFAVEVLINEYTQSEVLTKLDSYIDNITLYDTSEIKQELANILLYIEEKTHISEEVFLMSDLQLVDQEEINSRVMLGLNNTFDANTGGVPLTELIMIGGMRGTGKSVVCTNITNNQYEQGNIGLYFSIEMRAREVFSRSIAALAEVDYGKLRRGASSEQDLHKIAEVRAGMFLDSEEIYEDYKYHNDYNKFEQILLRDKVLKPDNQLIIVDNQNLTLADIDLNIQKFKAQFGDKLKVVTVDYVNAIVIDDIYSWKSQLSLSAGLKNLARKYEVCIVAPYQIDKSGEARFSKGILDKADIAIILEANENYIKFTSTKTRNVPAFEFASPIEWDYLRMDASDAVIEETEKETKKVKQDDDDLPF